MKAGLTLFVTLFCFVIHGQSTFVQTTNMVGIHDETSSLIAFDDGNIFAASNHAGCPWPGAYLSKFDSLGNRNWTKTFLYNGDSIRIDKIIKYDNHTICGYGSNIIFKMDTSGFVYWCRQSVNISVTLTDINTLPDGSIVTCGYYNDSTNIYSYVSHISNSGLVLNEVQLLNSSTPFGIAVLNDSTIVIGTNAHYVWQNYAIELIKLTANLQCIQKVEISKDSLTYPCGISLSSFQNKLFLTYSARTPVTANLFSFTVLLDSTLSPLAVKQLGFNAYGQTDFNSEGKALLFRYASPELDCIVIDTLGNIMSGYRYSNSPWTMVPWCANIFPSGGYLIGGYFEYPAVWDKGSLYIKTNSLGNGGCLTTPIQYQSILDSLTFTSAIDSAISLSIFTNSGTLIASNFELPDIVFCHTIGIEEDPKLDQEEIAIYPNPNQGIVNINSESGILNISLYSATGELVLFQEGNSLETAHVEMQNFQSGMYFIEVMTERGYSRSALSIAR